MKKAWNFVKALWFWYVVRTWWDLFPPKSEPTRAVHQDEGQTLNDD